MPGIPGSETGDADSSGSQGSEDGTGEEGSGEEGSGEEGSGEEGTGTDTASSGTAGTGAEGTGSEGTGSEGTGSGTGGTASSGGQGSGSGDGAFDKALEDFDGAILEERGIIIARANESAGSNPMPPPDDVPGGRGGKGTGGGNGGMPGGKALPLPDAAPAPEPPATQQTAQSDLPADIADARDDDVVARQLREAAMRETDPQLREKLWAEYRRYKGGS